MQTRWTVLHDACFSQEALDAFNTGDACLRAAQNGLARATEQYVKDIRVSKRLFDSPPRSGARGAAFSQL